MKIFSSGKCNEPYICVTSSEGTEIYISAYPMDPSLYKKKTSVFISYSNTRSAESPGVPEKGKIFASAAAAASFMSGELFENGIKPKDSGIFHVEDRKVIRSGDIVIEPVLDKRRLTPGCAYIIKADGKKILYTDLRDASDHRAFKVDAVIYGGLPEEVISPGEIFTVLKRTLENERSTIFLYTKNNDLPALADASKACRSTKNLLVLDLYSAFLSETVKKYHADVPDPDKMHIKIKFTKEQAEALDAKGYGPLLMAYDKHKIDNFAVEKLRNNAVVASNDSEILQELTKKSSRRHFLVDASLEGSEDIKQKCETKGVVYIRVPAKPVVLPSSEVNTITLEGTSETEI